ncbi:DUF6458 family protein [Gephyromycinifex aptenodytis]|uniref:DUF6458 family protein n=1 Tax=Gephyromycinifex aptenodytis TaxID=2716227 RepID=UPI001445EF9A|nr:DUF6458 family protein [Gephyromycinifex aptenodytis]
MSVGLGIFLIALGAILSFAVSDALPGVNLQMIGWILMAAGLATTVISVIMMSQRRTNAARTTTTVERDAYGRP